MGWIIEDSIFYNLNGVQLKLMSVKLDVKTICLLDKLNKIRNI